MLPIHIFLQHKLNIIKLGSVRTRFMSEEKILQKEDLSENIEELKGTIKLIGDEKLLQEEVH